MADQPDDSDRFIKAFHKYLTEVDQVAQMVLSGHLDVEFHLDDVLRVIFWHPKHLQEGRLTFVQKLQVVRSYSLRVNDYPQWSVILAFNRLRNDIAHGRDSPKRRKRIGELRNALSGLGTAKFRDQVKEADGERIVAFAAAMSSGFLLTLKDDLVRLRRIVEGIDAELHPDQPRIVLPLQEGEGEEG
jgi:hypothetical protein